MSEGTTLDILDSGNLHDPDQCHPHDELSTFMHRFFAERPLLQPPSDNFVAIYSPGVFGSVLYREGQFQVELFMVTPNFHIPPHAHDNVDSYEVQLQGMSFYHEVAEQLIPEHKEIYDDIASKTGSFIRVKPDHLHWADAGKEGGMFISVQHWLNGVKPSSVGKDWTGKVSSADHLNQVQTGEAYG
jgi:hypothetical protein